MSNLVVSNRMYWADACRVVAIFGVVLIHSCGEVFYSYGKISIGYWLPANILDSLARVAVPLFVMISGALLMKSGDMYSVNFKLIGRRIVRVLVPLIVWSMVSLWWVDFNTPNKTIDPVEWLQKLLSHPVIYHLWFVYMIIGLYIMLPIMQVIFNACENNEHFKYYFFAVWIVFNCLSIYIPMPFILPIQITMVIGYGGYFILGGLLNSSHWDQVGTHKWWMFYLIGIFVTFLVTWVRTNITGVPDELAYSYFSPNVFIASVGAFMLFRRIKASKDWVARVVHRISDVSFLIYFAHVFVLDFLRYGTFGMKISTSEIHPALSIPMLAFTTFLFSLVFALLIRLIPGSRRVFG